MLIIRLESDETLTRETPTNKHQNLTSQGFQILTDEKQSHSIVSQIKLITNEYQNQKIKPNHFDQNN